MRSALGGNATPAASDARWWTWAVPLCAWLARRARSAEELRGFAGRHRVEVAKASNVLAFAINERLAAVEGPGRFALTDQGRRWLEEAERSKTEARAARSQTRIRVARAA